MCQGTHSNVALTETTRLSGCVGEHTATWLPSRTESPLEYAVRQSQSPQVQRMVAKKHQLTKHKIHHRQNKQNLADIVTNKCFVRKLPIFNTCVRANLDYLLNTKTKERQIQYFLHPIASDRAVCGATCAEVTCVLAISLPG